MSGMLGSALIGLVVTLAGLLIVHLTPDDEGSKTK